MDVGSGLKLTGYFQSNTSLTYTDTIARRQTAGGHYNAGVSGWVAGWGGGGSVADVTTDV